MDERPHPSGIWPPGLERGLRNYWYPICPSDEVGDAPVGLTRLSENLVVWRDSDGAPHTMRDRCAHRGAALSIGRIWGDLLECKYHGFVFDGTGQCRDIPTERHGRRKAGKIRVASYPTAEAGGAIWAYLHDGVSLDVPPLEVPEEITDERFVGWWTPWVFDTNWLLVQDNNGDVLHVPFLHDPRYAYEPDGRMAQELRVREVPGGFVTEFVDAPSVRDDDPSYESDSFVFKLPGMVSIWLPPKAIAWLDAYHNAGDPAKATPEAFEDEPPYKATQWMLPIDQERTLFMSWYGRACETPEEREHWETLYHQYIHPSEEIVFSQDNEAFRSLRGLELARSSERLFNLDVGTIKIRKLLTEAFLSQQDPNRQYDGETRTAAPSTRTRPAARPRAGG